MTRVVIKPVLPLYINKREINMQVMEQQGNPVGDQRKLLAQQMLDQQPQRKFYRTFVEVQELEDDFEIRVTDRQPELFCCDIIGTIQLLVAKISGQKDNNKDDESLTSGCNCCCLPALEDISSSESELDLA
jgi:hypothetical protein